MFAARFIARRSLAHSATVTSRRTFMQCSHVLQMPVKTIDVPTMGDSITEGTVVEIPIAPPVYVNADDVVVVLETDKVSVDVRSPEGGIVTEIFGDIDDVVEVGQKLFELDTDGTPSDSGGHVLDETPAVESKQEPASPAPPKTEEKSPETTSASPTPPPPKPAAPTPAPTAPVSSDAGPDRSQNRVKMSRMRQRVATRLKEAQNTAAMLTTFQEVDMGNLMELRSKYKDNFLDKHGVKLGFMSAFVKAATAALQEIPAVNAYIDNASNEIVYHNYCDISVAVASPSGLVVPVLRNTENMSFADVEKGIMNYAMKAKEGTLALEDMAGGTFTISNGGVFGSLMGTPIINPPQSAILGMHATKLRPVVDANGEIVARPMMYMALTYDHRLIDGREGVTFLKSIKEKIEDPGRLLLEI